MLLGFGHPGSTVGRLGLWGGGGSLETAAPRCPSFGAHSSDEDVKSPDRMGELIFRACGLEVRVATMGATPTIAGW